MANGEEEGYGVIRLCCYGSRESCRNPSLAGDESMSSSSSSSSPRPSSPSTPSGSERGGDLRYGSDPMDKDELDAARALADFAQMARIESESRGQEDCGADDWGRRSRKRMKSGSPPTPADGSLPDLQISRSSPCSLGPRQNTQEADHQCKGVSDDIADQSIELQRNYGSSKSTLQSFTRKPFHRGRAKHYLTEALCDELTRRAADLSRDNENMKIERGLAMKEYLLLKETNRQLKEQMPKMVKCEVKETLLGRHSIQVETTSSPTISPLVVYRTPTFPEIVWPSFVQPLNSVLPSAQTMNPYEQGVTGVINGLRSTMFVRQYPLFYPVIHHLHGSPHTLDLHALTDKGKSPVEKAENPLDLKQNPLDWKHDLRLSCSIISSTEKISSHGRGRVDAPRTIETNSRKDQGVAVGVPGIHISEQHSIAPRTRQPFSNVKSEADVSYCVGTVSEELEGLSIHPQKKLVSAWAAAEARKRRKELTKLKNLHGRQA